MDSEFYDDCDSTPDAVIVEPTSFDDVFDAVEKLSSGYVVIVNCKSLDATEAKRFIHFMEGATLSCDGKQQCLAKRVFLFQSVRNAAGSAK